MWDEIGKQRRGVEKYLQFRSFKITRLLLKDQERRLGGQVTRDRSPKKQESLYIRCNSNTRKELIALTIAWKRSVLENSIDLSNRNKLDKTSSKTLARITITSLAMPLTNKSSREQSAQSIAKNLKQHKKTFSQNKKIFVTKEHLKDRYRVHQIWGNVEENLIYKDHLEAHLFFHLQKKTKDLLAYVSHDYRFDVLSLYT